MTTALVPFPEVKEMAAAAARSGLFPGAKTPETALALMLLAQAEGIHPMQAMRRYHVIDGQPTMRADAMLASFQAGGGRVTWRRSDEQECRAVFEAPGVGAPFEVAWTMEDAKRAGVGGKRNWAQYPRQMLRARVVSEGVRATMPGVCMGIYTPEEVQDFDARPAPAAAAPAAPTIDAEAAPAAAPAPAPAPIAASGNGARASKERVAQVQSVLRGLYPDSTDERKAFVARVIGDHVDSLSSLSDAECQAVIDAAVEARL
jgi:hypothetical protein